MTKSLTKVWLGGMKRMLSPPAKGVVRDAQRMALDVIEAAASPAVADLSPPPARESRVR
ncbi:esterase, partial [Paraburkholderia sp. Se-20369]|nr:esterase [Paraburkholderia sp. Se-20369]